MIDGEINKEYLEDLKSKAETDVKLDELEKKIRSFENIEIGEKDVLPLVERLDFDKAPRNSVLVVKVSGKDTEYATKLQLGVFKYIIEPRLQLCKEKNLTVLFMCREDSIELLSETDMNKAGWLKRESSTIIDTLKNDTKSNP
jgi:hypothetical protein